jgi:hypothetical protein
MEDLFIVIESLGIAVALDDRGTPFTCPIDSDGNIEWEFDSDIDWDDLSPAQYKLFMTAFKALQELSLLTQNVSLFVK